MKVAVTRRGGFAGLTEVLASIDTANLARNAADSVERLIQAIGFFELPDTLRGDSVGADLYVYEIIVDDARRHKTVSFVESSGPETGPLHRLVQLVESLVPA